MKKATKDSEGIFSGLFYVKRKGTLAASVLGE